MKRFRFLILSILALACTEAVIEKPKNLIGRARMVNIYYDLAIIASMNATGPNVLKENHIETMPYIYEKYGVDSLQFAQSDLYYASIPLQYQTMYQEVEARLQSEQKFYEGERDKKADSLKEANQKKTDSLKLLKGSAALKKVDSTDQ